MVLVVKNLPTNAGDIRDMGSIPGSGRSPGGGHGNPLQYSCPETPMDRGALRAAVHGVARVRTEVTKQEQQRERDRQRTKALRGRLTHPGWLG